MGVFLCHIRAIFSKTAVERINEISESGGAYVAKNNVYAFGDGKAKGRKEMKNLLGGKGANLAEMTNLGIPVPAGFTITTDVCTFYSENNGRYPKGLKEEVKRALAKVEKAMGRSEETLSEVRNACGLL